MFSWVAIRSKIGKLFCYRFSRLNKEQTWKWEQKNLGRVAILCLESRVRSPEVERRSRAGDMLVCTDCILLRDLSCFSFRISNSPSSGGCHEVSRGVTRCQTAFYKVKLQSKWDVSDLLIISPVQTALSSSNFCRMSPQSSTIKEPTA